MLKLILARVVHPIVKLLLCKRVGRIGAEGVIRHLNQGNRDQCLRRPVRLLRMRSGACLQTIATSRCGGWSKAHAAVRLDMMAD